jgi:diguanylate cyclase (GGDEF)-like protein
VLEGIGFSQVAVALVNRDEGVLQGELGLGLEGVDVKALRVPLAQQQNLLVMALQRKSPVGIVHLRRAGLGELIGAPLEEGAWRESVGAEVAGATAAVVAVPLIAREEVVGVIGVVRTEPPLVRRHEIELLLLYANTAALTVERAELYARMHKTMENLEITDHVSRLFTLQHGQQRTREEMARCAASGLSFAALLIGVDAFKEYNERCGHDLGDRSLAEIAAAVRSALRGGDVAFRYGGRLIAVALPGASREQAAMIAESVQDRLRRERFAGPGGARDQVITVSIGLAAWAVGTALPAGPDIFKVVLERLHQAESLGGNRVCASEA